MPHITILQPDPIVPPQRLSGWLAQAGAHTRTVDLTCEPVPPLADCGDGIILLGGRADALDYEASPWIPQVHELLRAVHAAQVPVLGICLGHQIVADCFGGEVAVGLTPQDEEGATRITLTDTGKSDPILGALGPAPIVAQSHHDAVTALPPGATLLASSDRCPIQAMRLGPILTVQFHPEVTPAVAGEWAERSGHDGAAIAQELLLYDDSLQRNGQSLIAAFVKTALNRP
ncbi:type 1 glutamine amidotransferase [Corynebacterium aquatimens]|uniref:type 1 glutamine amidotransferase n=1 Tax=Corynebacterium TaxID=1716 RepID=UPI001F1BF1FD|nr:MULTISPECIES: type 1 glutamine amidotransferase [Corynebacterium]QYH20178.1 type 1 glutamine amidotransferase [Corynebacterium aquatimens]UIZ92575.1 type 1 glutamine amidotransferase [Corynebacterium sp. CNCTC7651]